MSIAAQNNSPASGPGWSLLATSTPLGNFLLPLLLTLALLALSFTARIQQSETLVWSFRAAVAALLGWLLVQFLIARQRHEVRGFSFLLRPQHYIQAMVQLSVYSYWGYYWRPVYDHATLILAQLIFAYVFDILLAWSRRRDYTLGFGPLPIICSINLFLWFRDDWFYMQFLMIALGFMGKEYVRWQRDGRSVHIFNPSAFALGLISLVLLLTNTSHLTWGQEIASTLTLAPNIYTYLFLVGLVVMYFFSITLVSGFSALTLFGLGAIYSAISGVPYFLDSEIPAAVFLGLHLLVTDPSTSPRTPLGKIIFGMLYGIGVFALYKILGMFGVPTFYDKLLCVPLLNLSVIAIDRIVNSINSKTLVNVGHSSWLGGRLNLVHMSVWIVLFSTMTLLSKTDGRHTGDSLVFWQDACAENLPNACGRLLQLERTYCGDNAAWACNELGLNYREGNLVAADAEQSYRFLSQACELKFQAACANLLEPELMARAEPLELDLRLMLREGGLNLLQMPLPDLYARACDHGWSYACTDNRNQL